MKIKTNRSTDPIENNYLIIYIGEDVYRITESIDGKLSINKTSDGDTDMIRVHPRSGNEIDIS